MDLMGAEKKPRIKAAYLVCLVGLLANLLLGVIKILIGYRSGYISVIGDGINNLSDMGSVALLVMTFYYVAKPTDKSHPFGYGRLEYINTTVMAALILYVGIALLIESVKKILHPVDLTFSFLLLGILLFSIAAKLFLAWWYRRAGRKLNSQAFSAYSADSVSDIISTGGVAAALVVERLTGLKIDGYMGVILAVVILYTGYRILKHALNSIIGTTPDSKTYEAIKKAILSCPGVYGVHDLIVHDYGPENHFATAHVELDSNLNLVESHEISEYVMTYLHDHLGVQATIHADPKAVSNPREREYRKDLESAIYQSGLPVTCHDFFVIERKDGIYMSFELALRGPCKKTDQEIYDIISAELHKEDPHFIIEMKVDRNFITGKMLGSSKNDQIIMEHIQKIESDDRKIEKANEENAPQKEANDLHQK